MYTPVSAEFLPEYLFGLSADCYRSTGRKQALDFLRLLAKDTDPTALLAFDARRKQLIAWGEDFAAAAAADGFALVDAEPLRLVCVSCGAVVTVTRPDELGSDFRASHHLGCQLSRVRALCSQPTAGHTRSSRPSLQTRRLKAHLRSELASSKAQVAKEFLYNDDVICMALARQFLKSGRAFRNAGELIDELTELTLSPQLKVHPVIEGLAELIHQLTPPPTAPVVLTRTPTPPERDAGQNPQVTDNPPAASSSSAPQVDLRRETELLLLYSKCKVCRERDLCYVTLPCSHFVFCEECHSKTKKCPVCETEVHSVIRTYKA